MIAELSSGDVRELIGLLLGGLIFSGNMFAGKTSDLQEKKVGMMLWTKLHDIGGDKWEHE